jgi:hypothetical protein
MNTATLVEIVCATHLSSYVQGPFKERGGLMLYGPPGVLKSTFLSVLDTQYHDAITLSDINARSLIDIRDQIASGSIRTIVLPELQKIYERHPYTAANVEGTLRAMAGEGFAGASFQDQRIARLKAHATVIAAMTTGLVEKNFTAWNDSGFNRRFLWALIGLSNPEILNEAVIRWELLDFKMPVVPRSPHSGMIPNLTTVDERRRCRMLVKYQPGGSVALQAQLLSRMLAVLKWWYRETGRRTKPMETIEDFAPALTKQGAIIDLATAGFVNGSGMVKGAISPHDAGQQLARSRWDHRPVKKAAKRRRGK